MLTFKGFIQVYTGNGKGKTTAALGLAVRAAGWGYRTYMAQFLKKGRYGELRSIKKYLADWVTIQQFGLPFFHHPEDGVSPREREAAERGMRCTQKAMESGNFRIVIMDEINTLLHFHIVEEKAVLQLLDSRPTGVELVLTGRYAPPSVLARADLITDMHDIRHYFAKGVAARRGIEN